MEYRVENLGDTGEVEEVLVELENGLNSSDWLTGSLHSSDIAGKLSSMWD